MPTVLKKRARLSTALRAPVARSLARAGRLVPGLPTHRHHRPPPRAAPGDADDQPRRNGEPLSFSPRIWYGTVRSAAPRLAARARTHPSKRAAASAGRAARPVALRGFNPENFGARLLYSISTRARSSPCARRGVLRERASDRGPPAGHQLSAEPGDGDRRAAAGAGAGGQPAMCRSNWTLRTSSLLSRQPYALPGTRSNWAKSPGYF